MNLSSFTRKLESPTMSPMVYERSYNDFWAWKVEAEASGKEHILDERHRDEACRKLLHILPKWQTYRGVKCDYKRWLPVSLCNVARAYDRIRNQSLVDFHKIPIGLLEWIWHELGRVKTASGSRSGQGEYYVIAVCKPLMFLWGQTPPFDSINRTKMGLLEYGASWNFREWVNIMKGLQRHLLNDAAVINYCRSKALEIYGSQYVVPYGRFLDIYYH
jgi:hypothetical protein